MESGFMLILLLVATLMIGTVNPGLLLFLCMAGALTAGISIFKEVEFEPSLFRKKGSKLGPSYWGVYAGNATEDGDSERTIEPPAPFHDADGLAGGLNDSSGRAVKSAH